MKIFISYSHKDTDFKNQLLTHLKPLQRTDNIEIFHDDVIDAGEKLLESIETHLSEYDVIIFLLSPDFLASDYCVDIELQHALEHEKRIIPIIVRPCIWDKTALKDFKIIPRDAKPISRHENSDDAWIECISAIHTAVSKTPTARLAIEKTREGKYKLNDLLELEVEIQHKFKKKVALDDIFVFPDLKHYNENSDSEEIKSSSIITSSNDERILIYGDEQSGKKSLARMLFLESQKSQSSFYIKADAIGKTSLQEIFKDEKYIGLELDKEIKFNNQKNYQTLIVEDLNKIKIGRQHLEKLIKNLSKNFKKIILISSYEYVSDHFLTTEMNEFKFYEILPFGFKMRDQLYERWITLGREYELEQHQIEQEKHYIKIVVDGVLRKNITPSKPFFILTIIQHLEIKDNSNTTLSSLGHCYQSLITYNLKRANITSTNIDSYINLMSYLARIIFESQNQQVAEDAAQNVISKYASDFHTPSPVSEMIEKLKDANILERKNHLRFKYRYIYYYFAARQITKNIEEGDNEIIDLLCNKLHLEEMSNILLFICHHTESQRIIDDIRTHATCTLWGHKELKFETPKIDPAKNEPSNPTTDDSEKSLKILETISKNIEIHIKNTIEDGNLDNLEEIKQDEYNEEKQKYNEIVKELIKSSKSIEILGQIVKNRFGSLRKPLIKSMITETYDVGLRFLSFYIDQISDNTDQIIDLFLKSSNKDETIYDKTNTSKIVADAQKQISFMCYNAITNIIAKISLSIGTHQLLEQYQQIFSEEKSPASYRLISLCILMQHSRRLPKKEIEENLKSSSAIVRKITQYMVLNFLYLYDIKRDDKNWLAEKFNLSIEHLERNDLKRRKLLTPA